MYEKQIEQKRRYIQSLEQQIEGFNHQQDILESKIRQYELAQQRSPQSAMAYARQIDSLKRQIDDLRNKRIYAADKLQKTKREISLLEKAEADLKAKQAREKYSKGGNDFETFNISADFFSRKDKNK